MAKYDISSKHLSLLLCADLLAAETTRADAAEKSLADIQASLDKARAALAAAKAQLEQAENKLANALAENQKLQNQVNQLEADAKAAAKAAKPATGAGGGGGGGRGAGGAAGRGGDSGSLERMKNLEAENARLMLIVKKLTDALNDAHFDVRSKADMIASLEHFKQEIPVLRQQLEDAVSGSCVCSVCQGMPEGAACALCAKKIPPPPPPHRTKKVFQSALLTKKPGKPSVTFGVAASAPGKYMGKSSKSNEADTQNQIDNYDPNWSATGARRTV